MLPEHRAFFAALALTRTFGRPVEQVHSKSENKTHAFAIALHGEFLNAYDPAQRIAMEGRLPLLKFLPAQRVVAFKGKSDMFQGYDHGDNTHFRVKVMEDVAELFDVQANRAFFYSAVENYPEPAASGDPAAEPPASGG